MLINLATEDELSEAVGERLIEAAFGEGKVGFRLGRKGNGYLASSLPKFRSMARREPVLIITDLDSAPCPPHLLQRWLGGEELPENLLLRVAVRETETWVLADRNGFADFLGVSSDRIPREPEAIPDPKRFLLNLARRAKRDVRSELIAAKGAVASQGIGYNRLMSTFVANSWCPQTAAENSGSLSKALVRLRELAERAAH